MRTAFTLCLLCCTAAYGADRFVWENLPPLPRGLGGQAVGVHNGTLFVAGGSAFDTPPWDGGAKRWFGEVYTLEPGAAAWTTAAPLPEPRGYAAVTSVDTGPRAGVYLIGGADGGRHFDSTVRLTASAVTDGALPPLPGPRAMAGAALVGTRLYLVGGSAAPDAASAYADVLTLDFGAESPAWESVAGFPGPGRILPAVTARDGALYVFSGAELTAGPDGSPSRRYLNDAYRYTEKGGWQTIAPMPRPAAAASAVPYGQNHLFVLSGDDGALFDQTAALGADHPGFPKEVLAYHPVTDTWAALGAMPEGLVCTGAVVLGNRLIVAGGEDRPGHRSSSVMAAALTPHKDRLGMLDYGVIGVYLGALVIVGAYFSRREKDTETFFLGGRKIPWWAVGLSIVGTSLSSITYLTIPAKSYATDWVFFLNQLGIVLIAPLIAAYYIPAFRATRIDTAYEYLEKRFNLAARMYGSLVFILFQAGRVSIVLYIPAIALSASTGLDKNLCIVLMGVLATAYTVMGGIEAVIWTDVIQTVVLLLGGFVALYLVVVNIEGDWTAWYGEAAAMDKLHMANWTWDPTVDAVWVCIIGSMFALAYPNTADQTIVQRFLTTKTDRDAKKAIWTHALMTVPNSLLFFGLGTALWLYFRHHPAQLDPALGNDAIFPLFIVREFPIGLKGLIIAGIFAAAMSSLDSSINSVASVIVGDYYRRFSAHVSEKRALFLAKAITLGFGVFGTLTAIYLASLDTRSLFDEYLKILGLVGGGLAGMLALGVFTKRVGGAAAVAGAVVSAVVMMLVLRTPISFLLHGMVGFLTAYAVGYGASFVLPNRKAA